MNCTSLCPHFTGMRRATRVALRRPADPAFAHRFSTPYLFRETSSRVGRPFASAVTGRSARLAKAAATPGGDEIRGGEAIRNGGLTDRSSQSGLAGVFRGAANRPAIQPDVHGFIPTRQRRPQDERPADIWVFDFARRAPLRLISNPGAEESPRCGRRVGAAYCYTKLNGRYEK